MSRLILIQEDDYDRQYLISKEYLHYKYHNHPTHLKNIELTEEEQNWISVHGAIRYNLPTHAHNGKLVI